MADYTLYCFKESGNAYKAALMLSLSGCEWRPIWVDFFGGETRTPEFRKLNPMGEVPVLVHGDVQLTQSGVMLDYLAAETGRFGPSDEAGRREILRWTLWDNHKLTGYTATYRFLRNFMPNADPGALEFLRGRVLAALKTLETHLTGRDFVAADGPTTADLSLCGYLFFEEEFGVSWDDYPAIAAWLGRIKALEGWQHPYEMLPGGPVSQ